MDRHAVECKRNKYGYRLNINHPAISALYDRFKKWKNIPLWCPLSDAERMEFEDYVMNCYKKENKKIRSIKLASPERIIEEII